MPEFRLYTPEGASMDLDMLIDVLSEKSEKAKLTQESQRQVLEGKRLQPDDHQRATAEVAIQMGMEIAFEQSANLLREVKKRLAAKDAA